MRKPYVRLDKKAAAVLLVDHQAGLLSLVRDIEPDKFKNNVLALACELHRDWRNDIAGLGALFSNHIPDYRNLISSYNSVKSSR